MCTNSVRIADHGLLFKEGYYLCSLFHILGYYSRGLLFRGWANIRGFMVCAKVFRLIITFFYYNSVFIIITFYCKNFFIITFL